MRAGESPTHNQILDIKEVRYAHGFYRHDANLTVVDGCRFLGLLQYEGYI